MRERCSKIVRRFSSCRVFQQNPPKADEVGGSCSTGIECAKVQL